ncbi:hypothetical protein LEN26_015602 [Aphanomyces euteiches]|nr:hypothetical protein LEN26_015602 [Aphanomyces euteiches]KAH9123829.1 hypothetical protein AeMF1_005300 [Aphanomyces euteiches]KAH9185996.1 hypothetical protein AeNC1_012031 [Aphanomyces euteiches]
MKYAFEGHSDQEQLEKLIVMYRIMTAGVMVYGGVVETTDGTGALHWISGKNFPLGLWREIQYGALSLPFKLGFRVVHRLAKHDSESQEYVLKHASKSMGWIWTVGVAPEGQGKGHCRYLIETAIEQMRAQGMTEFWLTTDKEVNVVIYKKLGFEVMTERIMSDSGIKNWTMKRVEL